MWCTIENLQVMLMKARIGIFIAVLSNKNNKTIKKNLIIYLHKMNYTKDTDIFSIQINIIQQNENGQKNSCYFPIPG
jgi:hypothetical protein